MSSACNPNVNRQPPLFPYRPGRLPLFVDTSALVGHHDPTDARADDADQFWNEWIKPYRMQLCTSAPVVAETLSDMTGRFTAGRIGQDNLEECFALLCNDRDVTVHSPIQEDNRRAFQLVKQYADNPIGWVDCVSFAIMERLKLEAVFTFDERPFERHKYLAGRELRSFLLLPKHQGLLSLLP